MSEVSQKEKDKYHIISYIWNLIYGTNEPFHRKEIMDMENRFVVAKGGGGGCGMDCEFGANRCKPLPLEWIRKMWCIYTMKCHSAIKKNEIMPFAATWMEPETHTE